jgi:F0F1-type ATP synthase membrane subunit b/b'
MEAEARRVEEETKAAIAKIEHGAEVEIAAALHAARQELARTASELALDLARRKVSERMNPALQAGLVDEFSQRLNERAQ